MTGQGIGNEVLQEMIMAAIEMECSFFYSTFIFWEFWIISILGTGDAAVF